MRRGMLHAGGNISSGSHSGRMQEEGEEMMIGLVFISLPGGHGQPQSGFPRCPPAGAPGCWMPMQDIIFIFISPNIALMTFIFLAQLRLTFCNMLAEWNWWPAVKSIFGRFSEDLQPFKGGSHKGDFKPDVLISPVPG